MMKLLPLLCVVLGGIIKFRLTLYSRLIQFRRRSVSSNRLYWSLAPIRTTIKGPLAESYATARHAPAVGVIPVLIPK